MWEGEAPAELARIIHRRFNGQPKGVSLRLWRSGQPCYGGADNRVVAERTTVASAKSIRESVARSHWPMAMVPAGRIPQRVRLWMTNGSKDGEIDFYQCLNTDESDSAMEPPLCWITNAFDRSTDRATGSTSGQEIRFAFDVC